jgi:hypothetical protein
VKLRILAVASLTLMLALLCACSPKATPTPAAYSDPFAYCTAVGNMDEPDARYTGEAPPPAVVDALKTATGASADMPAALFVQGTYWRCMDGKVYGCFVGANLPCWAKANVDRTPVGTVVDFCKEQPNAEFIPAAATGHETVYEWRCKDGKPEIVRQIVELDARGYDSRIWYALN